MTRQPATAGHETIVCRGLRPKPGPDSLVASELQQTPEVGSDHLHPGDREMRGITERDDVVDDQRAAVPQAHEAREIDESRAERLGSPSSDAVRPVYDGVLATDAGA